MTLGSVSREASNPNDVATITTSAWTHNSSNVAIAAGINNLAPHDLRRTCARLCHLAGGELDQIQFLLGHVLIQTTERYFGCKQKLRCAVNDRLGIESMRLTTVGRRSDPPWATTIYIYPASPGRELDQNSINQFIRFNSLAVTSHDIEKEQGDSAGTRKKQTTAATKQNKRQEQDKARPDP
jgi:hypothetical protein